MLVWVSFGESKYILWMKKIAFPWKSLLIQISLRFVVESPMWCRTFSAFFFRNYECAMFMESDNEIGCPSLESFIGIFLSDLSLWFSASDLRFFTTRLSISYLKCFLLLPPFCFYVFLFFLVSVWGSCPTTCYCSALGSMSVVD